MKKIEVSDKDYETLMKLSKELQTQDNDHNAFPYFWTPRSTKAVLGTEDDTPMVYSHGDGVETLSEFAENNPIIFKAFLDYENYPPNCHEYEGIDESDWQCYIERDSDYRIVYEKDEKIEEQNHSIFKNDVKEFIDCNKHHLGGDPHTYAHTFFRMDRMTALITCLCRINPQSEENINHETSRAVKLMFK